MNISVSAAPRHAHVFWDSLIGWMFHDEDGNLYGEKNHWCRKEYAVNAAKNFGFTVS